MGQWSDEKISKNVDFSLLGNRAKSTFQITYSQKILIIISPKIAFLVVLNFFLVQKIDFWPFLK